jgi:hypothetical protein
MLQAWYPENRWNSKHFIFETRFIKYSLQLYFLNLVALCERESVFALQRNFLAFT